MPGPESSGFYGSDDVLSRRLAANGIRLVLDEFRSTETPIAREARQHAKRQNGLATRAQADTSPDDPDPGPMVETEG